MRFLSRLFIGALTSNEAWVGTVFAESKGADSRTMFGEGFQGCILSLIVLVIRITCAALHCADKACRNGLTGEPLTMPGTPPPGRSC